MKRRKRNVIITVGAFAKKLAAAGRLLELWKWAKTKRSHRGRANAYIGAAEGIIERQNKTKNSRTDPAEVLVTW